MSSHFCGFPAEYRSHGCLKSGLQDWLKTGYSYKIEDVQAFRSEETMKISIKTLSNAIGAIAILMLLAMGLIIVSVLRIQDSIIDSQERRFRSQLLAEELSQSSEELTRMARSYVATGDPIYERYYLEILAIRNGESPRPQNYSPAYWHLLAAKELPSMTQGETVSLHELMQREGLSERELNLLRQAQANSDELVKIERRAFAAIKGRYDDGQGAFTVIREPDRDFAMDLLYDDRYVAAKASIMIPIQHFRNAIGERTKMALENLQLNQKNQILLLMLLIVFSLVGVLFISAYIRRAVLHPLAQLGRCADEISKGDYGSHCDIRSGNELTDLGAHFNRMAQYIERDFTARLQAEDEIRKLNEALENKVKERTRQLLAAQEALAHEEKLIMLGQVADALGHELRHPLGVMSNAVYYLKSVLNDTDTATREYLGILKEAIADMERIVSNLLDAIRFKQPHPEPVEVAGLIEQTLRVCSVPATVTVRRNVPADIPVIHVDPMHLHHILWNLIVNGVAAMPQGGMLEISVNADTQAKLISISIKDSGIGMTPDQLDKLFQPYFATGARHIGLGLVVVKSLIQANGGQVEVISSPGEGSTFTVMLPIDELK